jgi:hypothetical protein
MFVLAYWAEGYEAMAKISRDTHRMSGCNSTRGHIWKVPICDFNDNWLMCNRGMLRSHVWRTAKSAWVCPFGIDHGFISGDVEMQTLFMDPAEDMQVHTKCCA